MIVKLFAVVGTFIVMAYTYLLLHPAPRWEEIPYAEKCKRRRADGPTPCFYCPEECEADPDGNYLPECFQEQQHTLPGDQDEGVHRTGGKYGSYPI